MAFGDLGFHPNVFLQDYQLARSKMVADEHRAVHESKAAKL